MAQICDCGGPCFQPGHIKLLPGQLPTWPYSIDRSHPIAPPYDSLWQIAKDYERRLYYFWDENERLRKAMESTVLELRFCEARLADVQRWS